MKTAVKARLYYQYLWIILTKAQVIEFLGLVISSIEMNIRLPDRKNGKLKEKITSLSNSNDVNVRDLASIIIGAFVATLPTDTHGRLHLGEGVSRF